MKEIRAKRRQNSEHPMLEVWAEKGLMGGKSEELRTRTSCGQMF
jgi:hypothetical protein